MGLLLRNDQKNDATRRGRRWIVNLSRIASIETFALNLAVNILLVFLLTGNLNIINT
jgi:hypothetical protein